MMPETVQLMAKFGLAAFPNPLIQSRSFAFDTWDRFTGCVGDNIECLLAKLTYCHSKA